MNRTEAIEFIENRPWQGFSLGMERMEELMKKLGNPQKGLKYVHVAGTNGKGSTCAMMTSILLKAGYKVGTFISPHLVNYEERFSVNNLPVSEKELIKLVDKVKKASSELSFVPRVFEILTAIGFLYFKKERCDIVVLEVGMGGRLDATNIIDESLVSVLMNIGLEHTEILGDTLEKIANEKAGIIKDNGDVVAYDNVDEVINTFKNKAKEKHAKITVCDFDKIEILKEGRKGQVFNYKNFKNVELSLLGKHQFYNAATVIEACNILKRKGYNITSKNIKDGLREANWNARLSLLATKPLFILDGAHNPQCAVALKESLPKLLGKKKAIMLCGMLKDKDYQSVMDMMTPFAKEFICLTPDSSRALDKKDLAKILMNKNQKAVTASSVYEGIEMALSEAGENGVVVAFGSLYLAGDIIKDFVPAYKNYLRKRIKAKREKLSRNKVIQSSNEAVKRIIGSKEFKKAKNILIYNSINNEVDLKELLKVKGKIYAYPLCTGDKIIPLIPKNDESFAIGKFGIREPIRKKSALMKNVDMVICPLVAFDEKLNRLGQGKGYYDRFLKRSDAVVAAVGYEVQKVENVPVDECDYPMTIIYSDKNTYRK